MTFFKKGKEKEDQRRKRKTFASNWSSKIVRTELDPFKRKEGMLGQKEERGERAEIIVEELRI